MKVPARKRDQLSLNSDHTHFIIIREQPIGSSSINASGRCVTNVTGEKQLEKLTDSSQSATNKFRDRFEHCLHQETLQKQTFTAPAGPHSTTTGINKIYFHELYIDLS